MSLPDNQFAIRLRRLAERLRTDGRVADAEICSDAANEIDRLRYECVDHESDAEFYENLAKLHERQSA